MTQLNAGTVAHDNAFVDEVIVNLYSIRHASQEEVGIRGENLLTNRQFTEGLHQSGALLQEYLHGFVVRVYDKVNEVWARQEVHQEELDTAFFAKSYLELRKKVLKAEEGKSFDDLCFVEYMPFSQGLIVPIRLNAVKVNLLTGTMAEINFDISDQDGYEVKMWWHLDYANGQWRIDDWKNDPDAKQSMVDRMTAYLKKHGVK